MPASHAYKLRRDDDGTVLIWTAAQISVRYEAAHLDHARVGKAVRSAFATWRKAGVPIRVTVHRSKQRLADDAEDGINAVRWEDARWRFGRTVVAMTLSTYSRRSGVVRESDIHLNAVDHQWSVEEQADAGRYDLQDVLTHEVGHFFGLGHEPAHSEATMFPTTPPGELTKRTLSRDDLAGVAALKGEIQRRGPAATVLPPAREPKAGDIALRPGCAVGAVADGPPRAWLLLLLAWLFARRGRRAGAAVGGRWSQRLLLGISIAALPAAADATTVRGLSLGELVQRSHVVMRARVISSASRREGGLIFTEHRLRVEACLKAASAAGASGKRARRTAASPSEAQACATTLTLRLVGGAIGDVVMRAVGVPRLTSGQRILLFARREAAALRPVGLMQGIFIVREASAIRDLRGVQLLGTRANGSREGGQPAAGLLERQPLVALERRVRLLISR